MPPVSSKIHPQLQILRPERESTLLARQNTHVSLSTYMTMIVINRWYNIKQYCTVPIKITDFKGRINTTMDGWVLQGFSIPLTPRGVLP